MSKVISLCSSPRLQSWVIDKLYKYAHITSIINNLGVNNGKTILLSCDSHAIPLIPILAYYYKKVIVLDNRIWGVSFDTLFKYEENNIETLLMLSYNNSIEKFIEQNLQ